MNSFLANKRRFIFLAISAGAVLFLLVLLFIFGRKDRSDLLVELPGYSQEEWQRKITRDEQGKGLLVTNEYDGYRIFLSQGWRVPEKASAFSGLEASWSSAAGEGIILHIIVAENPEGLTAQEWAFARGILIASDDTLEETVFRGHTAHKAERMLYDFNENGGLTPLEKSVKRSYILLREKKFYALICTARGDDFENLIEVCQQQIETFTFL